MDPHRVRAVARRIAAQFRRDRRTLGLLIGAPILILSLVGALWGSTTSQRARVLVISPIAGVPPVLAERLVQGLRSSSGMDVSTGAADDGRQLLEGGSVDAVVSARLGPTNSVEVAIEIEGSDALRNGSTLQLIQQGVLRALGTTSGAPPLQVTYLHGGADYSLLDYLAPLLIGLFAFFFTFLLSTVSFLRERTSGTLERLMATPLRRGELVLGYLAGFSLFALIQAAVIIAFTVLVLRVKYTGNVGAIFLIEAMLVIVSVALGLFISAFARTELQAVQFIPVVLLPQVFLSGLLVPIDQLPDVLRPIAVVLPLTYSNEALRAVMIRGFALTDPLILKDLAALAAFGAVTIAGAVASIRREVA